MGSPDSPSVTSISVSLTPVSRPYAKAFENSFLGGESHGEIRYRIRVRFGPLLLPLSINFIKKNFSGVINCILYSSNANDIYAYADSMPSLISSYTIFDLELDRFDSLRILPLLTIVRGLKQTCSDVLGQRATSFLSAHNLVEMCRRYRDSIPSGIFGDGTSIRHVFQ